MKKNPILCLLLALAMMVSLTACQIEIPGIGTVNINDGSHAGGNTGDDMGSDHTIHTGNDNDDSLTLLRKNMAEVPDYIFAVAYISSAAGGSDDFELPIHQVADTSLLAVGIGRRVSRILRTQFQVETFAGSGQRTRLRLVGNVRTAQVVQADRLAERHSVDADDGRIEQLPSVQFAENAQDSAGAVDVLNMVQRRVRRNFADHRHAARQHVDVAHREIHAGLLSNRQQVQHGIRRPPHRDIHRHRVQEGRARSDRPRQYGFVIVEIIFPGILDDQFGRLAEQLRPQFMRG